MTARALAGRTVPLRPLVLTGQVATGTSWGRAHLAEGRDVTVAATPDEAMDAIGTVLARRG